MMGRHMMCLTMLKGDPAVSFFKVSEKMVSQFLEEALNMERNSSATDY